MFSYMVTTDLGLEDFVLVDLKDHFRVKGKTNGRKGKIFFEGPEELVYLINYSARSINKLHIIVARNTIASLEDIKEVVSSVNWRDYISPNQTFAVRVNRVGTHSFSSIDVARISGEVILKTFNDRKPKVRLKNPDVPILIDIFHDKIIVAIDTTGTSLHIRRYRIFAHPYALRTTIAYAMIRMSGWDPETESLLDPTCGGGTIPIEAALFGRKVPHFLFRDEFAFKNFVFLDNTIESEVREALISNSKLSKKMDIVCIERNAEYYKGLQKNLEKSKTKDTILAINADALHMHEYLNKKFDVVIFNPPYHKPKIITFYKKLFNVIKKVTHENSRVVLITPHKIDSILRREGAEFELKKIFREPNFPNRIYLIYSL